MKEYKRVPWKYTGCLRMMMELINLLVSLSLLAWVDGG